MTRVTLEWHDDDPARPALDVLVRFIALTDRAHEEGRLEDFLMESDDARRWTWTGELPDDLRSTYQLCPVRDRRLRGTVVDDDRWWQVVAEGIADPAATDTLPPGCVFGAVDRTSSVLSLPGAPGQPWAGRREGVGPGLVGRHAWADGSVIRVQQPSSTGAPAALVVVFDGESMQGIGVPTTVDNLQADGVTGPLAAVYVDSIRGSAPRGPSRVASLTERDALEAFIGELVAFVDGLVPLDASPARRVLAGHSLGGLAALHLAHARPDLFGGVALGSAALWWPGSATQLAGAGVIDAVVGDVVGDVVADGGDRRSGGSSDETSRSPRIWMEVGTEEDADLLASNRELRDRLVAAGGDVAYREVRGGHDLATWRGGIGDALAHLL